MKKRPSKNKQKRLNMGIKPRKEEENGLLIVILSFMKFIDSLVKVQRIPCLCKGKSDECHSNKIRSSCPFISDSIGSIKNSN